MRLPCWGLFETLLMTKIFLDYDIFSYNLMFMLVTYLLPGLVMLFCYSRMCFSLWHTPIIGNYSDALARAQKDKQKVVKMFVFIILLFGICWLPYNLYFLYIYHDSSIIKLPFIKHVYLFLYWLAMANASINPFIYYAMNKRFVILI